MDALLEAVDRFREWHGTLAPWVYDMEAGLALLIVAADLYLSLFLFA